MAEDTSDIIRFQDLNLSEPVLKAVLDVGYEIPSPIQAQIIPHILAGRDVLGQAQTGTGKTAAFALPLLCRIDLKKSQPQVLVLAPTRELAIQVAEAFQRYATHLKGLHVLPIYGGQQYSTQLQQLKRGVHVIVGTPGRVMDHMRRGTLNLDALQCLVLDEADEMLRMGFIDDVEWVLEQTPPKRQVALFSATMPSVIRRIAQQHLQDPEEVTIKVRTSTAETINQRFLIANGNQKLDALTRVLEAETFNGVIIFVRTKITTEELAEKLQARGYSAAALNGDIAQKQRERTVERIKNGQLDILIATDVAARGLDVERISHVINYDIPYDTEAYVHRIGRTGRAGRSGEAILFVAPRETRMLATIERATRQKIERMELPSVEIINDKRITAFKKLIGDTINAGELEFFNQLITDFHKETEIPMLDIAGALAKLAQGDQPLLIENKPFKNDFKESRSDNSRPREDRAPRGDRPPRRDRDSRSDRDAAPRHDRGERDNNRGQDRNRDRDAPPRRERAVPEAGMARFRVDVGHDHGVKPGNLVGAIANETGIDSAYIGHIKIHDDYSTVDLPSDLPSKSLQVLQKTWVAGRQLSIRRIDGDDAQESSDNVRTAAPRDPNKRASRPAKSTAEYGDRPARSDRSDRPERSDKPTARAPKAAFDGEKPARKLALKESDGSTSPRKPIKAGKPSYKPKNKAE
ncbi:MAG: DEAD/DEAH box helicase [Gammaproteobacteria bacterium]|nr:DEAD/DEAH box helicase [Gammaproteobacteria bacterium]